MGNFELTLMETPEATPGDIDQMRNLTKQLRYLEDFVVHWVNKDRSIRITRVGHTVERSDIVVAFMHGERTLGLTGIPMPAIRKLYPRIRKLNESTFDLADTEGYVADEVWFQKRNKRLRINEREDIDRWFAPAEAFSELVLSYALSSGGVADIKELNVGWNLLDLTLVFFGADNHKGWHEELALDREEIQDMLEMAKLKRKAICAISGGG